MNSGAAQRADELAAADAVNRARLGPAGRRTQQASETAAARRSGTTRRGPLPAGYLQVAGPTGVPCGAQATRRDEEKHHSICHPRRATPRLATCVWSPRILCSASGASARLGGVIEHAIGEPQTSLASKCAMTSDVLSGRV